MQVVYQARSFGGASFVAAPLPACLSNNIICPMIQELRNAWTKYNEVMTDGLWNDGLKTC